MPIEYAVFEEYSPETKGCVGGWNTRVFNRTAAQAGASIRLEDQQSGIISLAPGIYHISGFSAVAYQPAPDQPVPPEHVDVRSPAAGGYCRLRHFDPEVDQQAPLGEGLPNDHSSVIALGSAVTANNDPSLFEGYLWTDVPARILLEHQSGSDPVDVVLRFYTGGSPWHIFARIHIRKIA